MPCFNEPYYCRSYYLPDPIYIGMDDCVISVLKDRFMPSEYGGLFRIHPLDKEIIFIPNTKENKVNDTEDEMALKKIDIHITGTDLNLPLYIPCYNFQYWIELWKKLNKINPDIEVDTTVYDIIWQIATNIQEN